MSKFKPNNTFHPAGLLLIGLLLAQILASIQVYHSNLDLYTTVSAVRAAGYLTIPNEQVMNSLKSFWPAFLGGLFFTFSIGAGLSLGSMAAAWAWTHVFQSKKKVMILFLLVWGGFLLSLNMQGFTLMPTLYCLLIPPALFILTCKRASQTLTQANRRQRWVHLIPILLLALLWFSQYNNEMFLDLRDNLLLSNYYGKKFSNFYYTYTLYPAEAFKSLDQKLIRTSGLENIPDRSNYLKIVDKLVANDYFPLPNSARVDLKINQEADFLVFKTDDDPVYQIKVNRFLSKPNEALLNYSAATDRYAAFRQFTFFSLLIGFPVIIYVFLHAAFYYPVNLLFNQKTAALTASMFCLLTGIIVLIYFQSNRSGNIDIKNISEALGSESLTTRIAALKTVQRKKLEIGDYRAYPLLSKSQIPQERYWFVRTLAVSRRPDTFHDLLTYINEENTNVRSMAFYSLGLRKNPDAIRPILEKIKASQNWYTQMYAYKALRALGWNQTKSP